MSVLRQDDRKGRRGLTCQSEPSGSDSTESALVSPRTQDKGEKREKSAPAVCCGRESPEVSTEREKAKKKKTHVTIPLFPSFLQRSVILPHEQPYIEVSYAFRVDKEQKTVGNDENPVENVEGQARFARSKTEKAHGFSSSPSTSSSNFFRHEMVTSSLIGTGI
jgi:hypothetical protein